MKRQLIASFLVVFVCLGTIGVPLYSHTCSHEAKVFQTLFTRSTHCSTAQIQDEKELQVAACCQKKSVEKLLKKDDCCTDNVQLIQFHLPSIQKESNFAFVSFPVDLLRWNMFVPLLVSVEKKYARIERPPPKLFTTDLSFLCIWRI